MQLLLLASTLLLYSCKSVAVEHQSPHGHHHQSPHGHPHQSSSAAQAPQSGPWPEMELVVARFAEHKLEWLAEFCDSYNITIYNSASPSTPSF